MINLMMGREAVLNKCYVKFYVWNVGYIQHTSTQKNPQCIIEVELVLYVHGRFVDFGGISQLTSTKIYNIGTMSGKKLLLNSESLMSACG